MTSERSLYIDIFLKQAFFKYMLFVYFEYLYCATHLMIYIEKFW